MDINYYMDINPENMSSWMNNLKEYYDSPSNEYDLELDDIDAIKKINDELNPTEPNKIESLGIKSESRDESSKQEPLSNIEKAEKIQKEILDKTGINISVKKIIEIAKIRPIGLNQFFFSKKDLDSYGGILKLIFDETHIEATQPQRPAVKDTVAKAPPPAVAPAPPAVSVAPAAVAPAAVAPAAVSVAPAADIKFNIFKNDMKKDGINNISFEEYKRAINIKKKLEEGMYNLNLKEIIQFDRIKRPKKYKSIKDKKKRKKFKEAFRKISYKYLYRKYKTKYLKLKNSLIIN